MRLPILGYILVLSLTAQAAQEKKASHELMKREQSAKLAFKQKQFEDVVNLLNPYTDEVSASSFITLAGAYNELKDFKNLVRILSLLSEKRPKDYHVHFMLGDAHIKLASDSKDVRKRQEEEDAGVAAFRTALRLNRRFRPAHQALVNFFQTAGLNHEAREQLNDMLKTFGDRGEIHADLCRLNSIDGFLQQAIKHCRRAMTLAPNFPESYVYLAQTYFDQKSLDKAETTLVQAARKFPKSEFVQYGAGQFFLKKNNYPVATKYLKRAVASQSESARSQRSLANALFESGLSKESLSHFLKACQIDQTAQGDLLGAASRLRLKGENMLAQEFSMASANCKK